MFRPNFFLALFSVGFQIFRKKVYEFSLLGARYNEIVIQRVENEEKMPRTRGNHLTQALKNSKTLYSLTIGTSLIPSKPKSGQDRLFELVVR